MDDRVNLPGDAPDDHPLRLVPIEVTVAVGRARPLLRDLMSLSESAVLRLDRRIEDPVDILVGDRLIARGELIEIEGGEPGLLGVRLTEVAVRTAG